MNAIANNTGFLTTMPFWNQIDSSTEPNYGNDVYTDVAAPDKVNTGTMTARISDLNKGFSAADLVTPLSGEDPLKFVAAHIDQWWSEQAQRRLIAMAIGLYNDNVAGNAGDMVVNVSSANNTVIAANQFSNTTFINGALTLGDAMSKLSAIAVHSVIYGKMLKDDQITFKANSVGDLVIPTYLSKLVIVDDGMPVIGGDGTTVAYKYLSIMFGPGAFGYGRGTPRVPFEYIREPDRGNGAGFETLWSRKRWVMHPYGYSFTSATITGPGLTPTWADLKLATNWTRVLNRKLIPISFLVTNA
jgi:hypothetical protein